MPARKPRQSRSPKRPAGGAGRETGARRLGKAPRGSGRPPQKRSSSNVRSDLPGERLQKVLAAAGIASRREAEQFILEGRVQVDGQTVTELGTRVDRAQQEIWVDGEPLPRPKRVYFAVHKPAGVVCTARDPSGRPRVIDLLPPDVGRVYNVGRLDLTSEGLILVTNDGELANQLTHPRHGVHKVYEVQVAGNPLPEVLAQLRRGMHLAEGFTRPVNVRVKARKKNSCVLEMVLNEGRNREIRRLLARVGHKVQRLTRIAVGPVRLGELPRGAVRPLTSAEVGKLRSAIREVQATGARQSKKPTGRPRQAGRRPAASAGKPARRGKSSTSKATGQRTSGKRGRR